MIRLNSAQKKSIEIIENHLLVLAGAGSGKTRVITSKIVHLIKNKHIPPYSILAITFTNKAAGEMKERLKEILSQEQLKHLQVRTFHSFGAMLLRSFIGHYKSFNNNFTIIDNGDQKKIIKSLNKDFKLPTSEVSFILNMISSWKNDFLYPGDNEEKFKQYETYKKPVDYYYKWYVRYQEHLQKSNLLDFDDLIALPVKIALEYKPMEDYLKNRWKYILIDEYQDTNITQEKMIQIFYNNGSIITAVGDDDQSIYSFRGANIANILGFEKKYKGSKVIMLEENYRSTQAILDTANDVIENNPRPYDKTLFTNKKEGEYPSLSFFQDDHQEANETALQIIDSNNNDINFNEIAVFYRTNFQSRILEEALIANRIPYQIIGGLKFFERKEVKDVLAYLNIIVNNRDSLSMSRVINFPPRGLGKAALDKIIHFAAEKHLTLFEAISLDECQNSLSKKSANELKSFLSIIKKYGEINDEKKISELIEDLATETGIIKHYTSLTDQTESNERVENIYQLLQSAEDFCKVDTEPTLSSFLEHVALHTSADKQEQKESIKLMTVHNAKGLEFNTVFITGMEEKIFPHVMSFEVDDGIEEERRLFYVAITRAKEHLYISGASRRAQYGSYNFSNLSRFISEIDKKHFKYYNIYSDTYLNEENDDELYFEDEHEFF